MSAPATASATAGPRWTGIGLVGRISGVGSRTSRVILVTDTSSRIPVTIQPSGQKAMLSGDNSPLPPLDFVEDDDEVRPGDRVVTSGDGGVFPAGLLVGQVVMGSRPAAARRAGGRLPAAGIPARAAQPRA
jgi:cell shape-determining protein MreC